MPKDVLTKRAQVSIAVPGEAEEGETAGYVAVERGTRRTGDGHVEPEGRRAPREGGLGTAVTG